MWLVILMSGDVLFRIYFLCLSEVDKTEGLTVWIAVTAAS